MWREVARGGTLLCVGLADGLGRAVGGFGDRAGRSTPEAGTTWWGHDLSILASPTARSGRSKSERKKSIGTFEISPYNPESNTPNAQCSFLPTSPASSSYPDGPAAPKEPGAVPGPSQCPAPSGLLGEGDFQFVLCEGCRQESPNLKLLTCLHTLPIPQPDGIPDVDNVLFSSLQARLRVYRRISSGGLSCCRCRREAAAVWCSECEEFLCPGCFEDHQWFFKKRSHEARKVEELRAESAHRFLEGTKKSCSLFCSSPGHTEQGHVTSIFCRKCEKPLCCSCALLDAQHSPFYCDIRAEIQRRQDELAALGQELARRRAGFEASRAVLQDEAARLEAEGLGVQELVRQRVEQLVRLIRQEEEQLLATVEEKQKRGRKELESELRRVEAVLRRMEAGERLVEKMGLYATEQEVMDMQPFVKDALEELRRQHPAADGELVLHEDFAECRARLQALAERIEGPQGEMWAHVASKHPVLISLPPHLARASGMAEGGPAPPLRDTTAASPTPRPAGAALGMQVGHYGLPYNESDQEPRLCPLELHPHSFPSAEDGSIIISSEDSEEDTVMSGTSDFTC
uniref:B box-type domain-containing protein n=1 Tax=Phasianus colchicus TaxID=9054 RepID=A0A669P4E9_PHACC